MPITKENAITIIDSMLRSNFEQFVSDTCNELIGCLNDAAADGKRKISGKKHIGYHPRTGRYCDVKLRINQEMIMQCALASISSSSMPYKNIVTFSKEFDLKYWLEPEDNIRAFSFKFHNSFYFIIPFISLTQTGKKFIAEVTSRLNKYGFKLSFAYGGEGMFFVKYNCLIPHNFKPLPLHGGLDFSKHLKDMDIVAQKLREQFTERNVKEKQDPNAKNYHFEYHTLPSYLEI